MAIDVGAACIDRGATSSPRTIVLKDNPANATGTINSVCTWTSGVDMTGVEFAVFQDNGGNNLTCKGNTDGSNLTIAFGSAVTKTAPGDFTAFAVNAGEYAGIFYAAGFIEADSSGGANYWFSGSGVDFLEPDLSSDFSNAAGWIASLLMTGTEAGGLSIPIAMYHYQHH